MKRVVLTSSVAALYGAPDERGADHAFDEHDWGLVPKENVLPYFYSKKIAEQRAWEIHDKQSRSSPVASCRMHVRHLCTGLAVMILRCGAEAACAAIDTPSACVCTAPTFQHLSLHRPPLLADCMPVGLSHRWKLVTVLPGQVWGPPISARHKGAESVKMMVSMLSGFFYPAAPPIGARC